MKESGQLHAQAALPSVPTGQEAGLAPEPIWARWRGEKKNSHCRESNHARPARGLVTKLTELQRFQITHQHR